MRAFFLKNLWRWAAGVPELTPNGYDDTLWETQWSPNFERLMRNRLVMGAMRYGRLKAPGKAQYDRIPSMHKRLEQFSATGNLELLVDVANLALLEFEESSHPKRHFAAIDDSQERVEKI